MIQKLKNATPTKAEGQFVKNLDSQFRGNGKIVDIPLIVLISIVTSEKTVLKTIILCLIITLGILQSSYAVANGFKNLSIFASINGLSTLYQLDLVEKHIILTKRGVSYDEAKDPALRKGTENWEEPQGSFFIIPAVIVGVIFVILFFNRE